MQPIQSSILSPLGITASQLAIGELYFVVSYLDDECLLPVVDSLIFLGRNIDGEDENELCFQDAESYEQGNVYPDTTSSDVKVVVTGLEPPPNLFGLDGALDELARCLERRKAKRNKKLEGLD